MLLLVSLDDLQGRYSARHRGGCCTDGCERHVLRRHGARAQNGLVKLVLENLENQGKVEYVGHTARLRARRPAECGQCDRY